MVDVGEKTETAREAVAVAEVRMSRPTVALVFAGPNRRPAGRRPVTEPQSALAKGDALATVRLAAISAVKRTAELIPLCHPVRVVGTDVDLRPLPRLPGLRIEVRVRAFDRTGVEMEAMVGAATAALTVYDMVKGVERGVEITSVRLELKRGGRTGLWTRRTMTTPVAPRETKPASRASRTRASRKPVPTP
jgi:cyclic pyranopterin phosphate synthase